MDSDARTAVLARQALQAVRTGEEEADAVLVALRRRALRRGSLAHSAAQTLLEAATIAEASGELTRAAMAAALVLSASPEPPSGLGERLSHLARRGASTPVGPFVLTEPLGAGSNAGVWRAVHGARPEEVAIKLVQGPRADHPAVRRALARELQVVAGLDHRSLVWLVDHGTVDAGAVAMTPELQAGTTWIALELASGTLLPHCGHVDWLTAHDVLIQLLDGLAHAHARGVLHLDLKPSNVLADGRPPSLDVRLADFGIARAMGAGERLRLAGTPEFMAPEQFAADARSLGPWTDLYALGCLAVMLVSGRPPYGRGTLDDLRVSHSSRPVPVLHATIQLPMGFEAWTRRLLAKHPSDRFQHAADAALALRELREAGPVPRLARTPLPVLWDATTSEDPTRVLAPSAQVTAEGPALISGAPRPALPLHWPRAKRVRRLKLQDAGLSLLPLRRPPLVGRERERSRLWAELREAVQGRPRVVILEGQPGIGVSRLGRWVAERAAELGAVTAVDARGAPVVALRKAFRAEGLSGEALLDHLARVLPASGPYDRTAIAGVLERGTFEAREGLVGVRMLHHLCGARPVLLRLGESDDELILAEACAHSELPLLVVVEREGLGSSPDLERLYATPTATSLPLGPLGDDDIRAFLASWLALDPVLAERIVREASGIPRRAVDRVTLLCEQEALNLGPQGYVLTAEGDWPALDADTTGRQRAEEVLGGCDLATRTALALAALLGPRVHRVVWGHACDQLAVEVPEQAVDRLVAAGLVAADPAGVSLVGEGVRAALCPEPRHAAVLHRACAAALVAHDERARAAEHLEAAGDVEAACDLLVVASDALLTVGRRAEASAVLASWRRLCEAQGTVDAPSRVQGWVQVAALARRERDQDTLEEAVAHIDASAGPEEPVGSTAAIAMARADLAHQRGDLGGFEAAVREARVAFVEAGDAVGEARAIYRLGALARQRGRLEQAMALLEEARQRARSMDPPPPVRWSAEILLGTVHVERGDLEAADASYAATARAARDRGDLSHLSDALNGLGEVARQRGDAEAAARWYAEAIEVRQAVGQRTVVARLNLALLYFQEGFVDDGDRHARLALREARESEKPLLAAASALRLIALCTAEQASWDRATVRSGALLRSCSYLDPDVFTALELAATRAHESGRQDRAQWCSQLASDLRQPG